MNCIEYVVDRRHVKLSTRPHHYRGVPRDVTHDDVIADNDDDDEGDVTRDEGRSVTAAEWRLSGLWVNDESDVCHVDPFIAAAVVGAAAAAAVDDDGGGDDGDGDGCVDRRRRRSRPDLVPRQSSSVTSPPARHHHELNKTCHDDVTVLCRLPSPVHCHCVPVSEADVIISRDLLTS